MTDPVTSMSSVDTRQRDHVVLLSEDGLVTGSASRSSIHSTTTPLHLAFSCYLIDSDGKILMTRRALTKKAWPGVWTNSFCGHPRPGESLPSALQRYAEHELATTLSDITPILPGFRYRATDASGIVENEVCPVFRATAKSVPQPNPDEALEMAWADIDHVFSSALLTPWAFSPWFCMQIRQILESGSDLVGRCRQAGER